MNRKLIIVILLMGLSIGCSPKKILKDPMKVFDSATRAYKHAISWSEYAVAAVYLNDNIEEKEKEAQIEHLSQFKVTAYEPRSIEVIEEDVRIRQVVKISYFKRSNMVVKSVADDQIWEYDPEKHTWLLLTGFPKFK
jgi:hypothetical protein